MAQVIKGWRGPLAVPGSSLNGDKNLHVKKERSSVWLDTLWLLDEVSVTQFIHWIYFLPIDQELQNLKLIVVSICIKCPIGDVWKTIFSRVGTTLLLFGVFLFCWFVYFSVSLISCFLFLCLGTVIPMLEDVIDVVPIDMLAVHFHDTYGQALSNILVSLQVSNPLILIWTWTFHISLYSMRIFFSWADWDWAVLYLFFSPFAFFT